MAQTIKLKRSAVAGRIPTTSDLDLGEVAINTYDGKMYMKKNVSGVESIVEVTSAQLPTDPTFDSVTLTGAPGPIEWNSLEDTVDIPLNSDVTLQVGQESVFRAKATEAISNGDAVMFAGAQGDHLLVAKADMSAVGFEPEYVIGIATQDFLANDFGFITTFGKVRGLNTAALSEGDILYLDPSVAGGLTTTKPTSPDHVIQMCAVVQSHLTQGTYLVRPTHMPDSDEIPEGSSNLYFTNQRVFDAADSRYVNVTGDTMTGNLEVSGQVTTGYGVRFNNGNTSFLQYNNVGENVLYMRDMTNGQMLTTWYTNRFLVNKNLEVSGTTTLNSTTVIQSTSPVLILKDTNGTGAGQSGFISLKDSGDIERGWMGYGSTSNTDFTVRNSQGKIRLDASHTYIPTLDLAISSSNSDHGAGTYFRGNNSHFVLGLSAGNTLYLNYGNSAGNLRLYGNIYYENTLTLNSARDLLSLRNATFSGTVTANNFVGSIDYSNITNPPVIDNSVDYINAASFNTGTGVLTLSGVGRAGATVNLDNRYLTSYSETDTLATVCARGNTTNSHIFIEGGNSLIFDSQGQGLGGDVALRANGEAFEIYEREDSDKLWLRIEDDPAANNSALKVNSTIGMATVWHAGNFTPSDYLLTSNYVNSEDYITSGTYNPKANTISLSGVGRAGATVDLDQVSRRVFACNAESTGSNGTSYSKVGTVTLTSQYADYQTTLQIVGWGNGSSFVYDMEVAIRVKQQNPFGSDPFIEVTNYYKNEYDAEIGYVIVQNTPSTVVELWAKVDGNYSSIAGFTTSEYQSSRILWNEGPFTTVQPTGYTSGTISKVYTNQNITPVTGLTHDTVNTELGVTFADGTTQSLDLSQYIDDTNLSRIVSGAHVGSGIVRFTRDDSTTFDVDFSDFFDDTNLARIVSASWNTSNGVLTLTRNDSSTVNVDLDNRYLTSYSETDTLQSVTSRGNTTNTNINIVRNVSGAKLLVESTAASGQAGVDFKNPALHSRLILDDDDLLRVFNQTSGFDAMSLKSDGSLVIKGGQPLTRGGRARLSIFGGLLSIGDSDNDMSYIRKQGTAQFCWQTNNGNNAGNIQLQPYGGNVIIGSTSGVGKLHVHTGSGTGDANTVFVDRTGTSDYSGISFATAGSVDWSIGQNSVGGFSIYENGLASTTRLVVKDGGNIGMGTTNPGAPLHVYRSVGYTASTDLLRLEGYTPDFGTTPASVNLLFKFQDSNNATNEARIKMATVNDTDYGDNDEAASNLIFETTNGGVASDKMIITGRGSIGIGGLNPQSNLSVLTDINYDAPTLGTHGSNFSILKKDGTQDGAYGLLAGVAGSGDGWIQAQRTEGSATAYKLRLQPSGGNVTIGGSINDDTRSSYYWLPDPDGTGTYSSHRFGTNHGYIDIGPKNTTYAHLDTDRSKFYFNKRVLVDEGIISSFNEDLYLRRAESADDQIHISTTTTTISQNTVIEGNLTVNGSISQSDGFGTLYTFNTTQGLSTSWADVTPIAGGAIPTGTYAIQIKLYNHDATPSGGNYDEHYSGTMSWFASDTNDNDWNEIPLHNAGHAYNGPAVYARTLRRPSGQGGLILQLAASGTVGSDGIQIKLRRLI